MRTVILAIAACAALGAIAPAESAAQGPPARAEAQRDQVRGQQAEKQEARGQPGQRAQSQRAQQDRRPQQAQAQRPQQAGQRPQQAQRPPQAQGQRGQQGQRPPQAQGQQGQRPPQAQGQRGQQGQRPEQARGQGDPQGQRPPQAQQRGARDEVVGAERAGPPAHARARRGGPAPEPAVFNRGLAERVVETRARRHGQAPALQVRRTNGELRMVRPDGRVVFALREETVDRLGYWRAVMAPPVGGFSQSRVARDRYPALPANDRGAGAPSFCRSGEGHPVWGRNWCLDKGFGLGDGRAGWAVARTVEDIVFGRTDTRRRTLDRDRLAAVLGEVAFGRLALQAVVLGATDPLTGTWIGDASGPLTLRVMSGRTPVAELVDYDRNGRVDTIVFNLAR